MERKDCVIDFKIGQMLTGQLYSFAVENLDDLALCTFIVYVIIMNCFSGTIAFLLQPYPFQPKMAQHGLELY